MNDLNPKETSPNNDFDEELVLTFLTNYHSLEQALVRAGFTRAGHTPGNPRPDWGKFARHIERLFDPDSSPELMGAVCYLLGEPEEQELRRERLQASVPGELSSPASDIVWLSENWSHRLTRLDPKTGQFTQMLIESSRRMNTPGFGNFAMAPDGTVWNTDRGRATGGLLTQYDPSGGTARIVKQWPLSKVTSTYDNTISLDGKYWAGGSPAGPGHSIELLDIQSGKMLEVDTGARLSIPARGGFDPSGNPWFGGRGGNLVMLDVKTGRMREFVPPLPYLPLTKFYEAMPDKNGEVWAGVNFGRGFVRLNPKTNHWTEYQLPEPFAYDRRTWIDNSTNPVSVWYVDYNGYIVRIQPLQ